jgi:transposase
MQGRAVIHEGSGRRRRWTLEEKGRIVALTLAAGATVSDVARQFDLSPQHLFQWRRAAKTGKLVLPLDDDFQFAPVVMGSPPPPQSSVIPIEVGGAVVRASWSTDFKLLAVVVGALRGAA